jgi:hypothetical protein
VPPSRSVGAKPLKTAISAAKKPSVLRGPEPVGDHAGGENARDSNDRREDLDGKNPVTDCLEKSVIHDSGNTVMTWNSA